jgi:hypothetical protein
MILFIGPERAGSATRAIQTASLNPGNVFQIPRQLLKTPQQLLKTVQHLFSKTNGGKVFLVSRFVLSFNNKRHSLIDNRVRIAFRDEVGSPEKDLTSDLIHRLSCIYFCICFYLGS